VSDSQPKTLVCVHANRVAELAGAADSGDFATRETSVFERTHVGSSTAGESDMRKHGLLRLVRRS